MSMKHKNVSTTLSFIEHPLISTSTLAFLVDIPVDIASSIVVLKNVQ